MQDLKNAISEATSAVIMLPDNATDRDYLASLQLQKIAPEKIRIMAPETREALWQEIFGIPPTKKEFAITINTAITPVDELRYEKNGNMLTIFLSHTRAFDKEALSFSEHIPPVDLVITVGFASRSAADRATEAIPRKGAVRHIWIGDEAQAHEKLSASAAGLLGRLMVRSRHDPELAMLWSFITREDFEKTGTRPEGIPELIKFFSHIAELPKRAAIFWQYGENQRTEGLLWSADPALLARVAASLGIPDRQNSSLPMPHAANFIEAETTLRKLLRQVE